MPASSCHACGKAVPEGARFCPACGAAVERASDTAVIPPPPIESGRVPVTVAASEPRFFGITPPAALLALGVGALGVGILLLVLRTTVTGIVLVAAGVLLLALFLASARRRRDSRAAAGAIGTIRERAAYYALAARTTSGARRELTRRRYVAERLAGERRRLLLELGEAAYAHDEDRAAPVRQALERLDADVAANDRETARVAVQARERLQRARLQVQPTESVRIAGSDGGDEQPREQEVAADRSPQEVEPPPRA